MKAKDSPKATRNKATYMSDQAFADLKQALEDALTFERGKRRDLNVARLQAPQPLNAQIAYHTRRVVRRRVSPNARRPRGQQM
jgi:hypothetical protein